MEQLINFFNSPFIVIIGGFSTIIAIISFIYVIFLILKGVMPVWYRIGMGLSKRKIAILSDAKYNELKDVLVDSKIFSKNNIVKIDKNSISKLESISVILIHWSDFQNDLKKILDYKKDTDALIVYAPRDEGLISENNMQLINNERNTVVVNFRGRLLNDVFTSLITTNYAKK